MTKIVSVQQMKALEAGADRAGVSYAQMMEAAGGAVADAILSRRPAPRQERILVLCGKGNNGGDGLVAAYALARAGAPVLLYALQALDEQDEKVIRLRQASVAVVIVDQDPLGGQLTDWLRTATVVVDAVFGTGVRLPLGGPAADLLHQVRQRLAERRTAPPLRVAVDCPSGLDCDTGAVDAAALPADLTITFAAAKPGQFGFPAADYVGELQVADIQIPADLAEWRGIDGELATPGQVQPWLPLRPRNAHKGTFGRALVLAGSLSYTGAAYLAGAAAYRSGAGLVTLAVPEPLHAVLAGQLPEATWVLLPHQQGFLAGDGASQVIAELPATSAVLFGPGFGRAAATAELVDRLLQAAPEYPLAWVVDADGLKLLSAVADWPHRLPAPAVLTPHPGEMGVLTGLSTAQIQAARLEIARNYAARWGHVVVLKGAFTVVAAPDGRWSVLPFALPALARAGTGDVLAGLIVGLRAQGVPAYEAAVLGAYLHGRCGARAARALQTAASVLAGDILAQIPGAVAELEGDARVN